MVRNGCRGATSRSDAGAGRVAGCSCGCPATRVASSVRPSLIWPRSSPCVASSLNQSVDQSTNPSIHQSVNQSINPSQDLVRVRVGVEHINDLLADLGNAIATAARNDRTRAHPRPNASNAREPIRFA
jgi:hypothetical protein